MSSRAVVVRYTVHPEHADENTHLVEDVYQELARTRPDGLHYATFRSADGNTFVHVAQLDGEDNPLEQCQAFHAFQAGLSERCSSGPAPQSGTLIGSYLAF